MQTQCVPCGKVLATESAAAKHVLKHPATAREALTARWGADAYVDGVRWEVYGRTVRRGWPWFMSPSEYWDEYKDWLERTGFPVQPYGTSHGRAFGFRRPDPPPREPYREIAWEKGERTCMWCEEPVKRKDGGGHHVLPRSEGGTDDPSNVRLVHEQFCHDRIEGLTLLMGQEPSVDQIRMARAMYRAA